MPEMAKRMAKAMEGPFTAVGKCLSESARVWINRWRAGKGV
jgi:hypothetical protein